MTDSSPRPIEQRPASGIDTTVSHVARIWNYWLGGKDNYPVDREVGDQILQILPDVARLARASRAFLTRAVRYLAGKAGIRQFLDIGAGLPTVDNTHEVAQRVTPHRLRRQQPARARARPRPAHRHGGGRHRLHQHRRA